MDNDIKTWLYDILQSVEEVESYFAGRPKRFDEYAADIKTKRAVERNIEIIGEATSRILKRGNEFHLEHARQIIGARNRIAHGYDNVSDELIWSIVINHLPRLKEEVNAMLNT